MIMKNRRKFVLSGPPTTSVASLTMDLPHKLSWATLSRIFLKFLGLCRGLWRVIELILVAGTQKHTTSLKKFCAQLIRKSWKFFAFLKFGEHLWLRPLRAQGVTQRTAPVWSWSDQRFTCTISLYRTRCKTGPYMARTMCTIDFNTADAGSWTLCETFPSLIPFLFNWIKV